MHIAKVAVYVDRQAADRHWQYGLNVFQTYVGEVLGHAGISHERVEESSRIRKDAYDVVIAAFPSEAETASQALWDFANAGGTVIAYGGLNGLAARLGAVQLPSSGAGYAELPESAASGGSTPLRFTAAQPWRAGTELQPSSRVGTIRRQRPDGEAEGDALLVWHVGEGSIHRWAIDIPTTIVQLQQGSSPVLSDGVPAPDGSAQLNEGIWKADDRMALDWEYDRKQTETGQSYFPYPYADLWREALIGHLLRVVTATGRTLPFTGYWPDGIQRVALISHDSDGNIDESAEATLRILKEHDVRSSWCMIEPGFSPEWYDRIKADGHELAFHYNALDKDKGFWDETEFKRQFAWLKEAAKLEQVTSNKDHYTIFHGWGELFAWCESVGIQVDQTRGPSKRGNVGFIFGTCHPYVPVAWANESNRFYDVLEIGFLTQDLDITSWADSSIIAPFLDQAARVEGIAHFLFHQVHILNKEVVRTAFGNVVREARARGFTFWTAAQINEWERSRRKVAIRSVDDGFVPAVEVSSERAWSVTHPASRVSAEAEAAAAGGGSGELPADLVVWIPLPEGARHPQAETKFGVSCLRRVVS